MAETSFIVQGFHYLKKAKLCFEAVRNDSHFSMKNKVDKLCVKRIDLIKFDFVTSFDFPQIVRDGIRKEWESDVLTNDNIYHQLHLLTPEKRELVETIVIALINGENINFEEDGTK